MKKYFKETIMALAVVFFSMIFQGCENENKQGEIKKTFVLSEKMFASTKTEIATLKPLKKEMKYYGKITVDNNKMVEIYPIVGGNVSKVFIELGDYVVKGQLLATIRSTEVAGFERELDDAKNDLIVAKNNWKVSKELFDGKLNSEQEVLIAKNQMEKAATQLHRIEEIYHIYHIKEGSFYEVRSPINGFIIQKDIYQDMLLRNDRTDNIFDIAEIDNVWAIANVNESDIDQVKIGIDAEVTTLSYPDKIFYGKVDKIINIIDPETKAMKTGIKLQNKDFLLKPEMRANIKLSYQEDKKMIAIPSSAIIFDKSKSFVMVYVNRQNIETRVVEVFRQIGNVTYISNGISENEKVITQNQLLIYDALND